MAWYSLNYHINGLHLFWDILYLDLARKQWNMKVAVISIVNVLGTIPKSLEKWPGELDIEII